jgi:predicted metal-dependent phosphoesterase TrpH
VEQATKHDLAAIAIVDHDVVDGLPEASDAAAELGVELVSGVELTASWNGRTVHILGYGLDTREERFLASLQRARELMAEHVRDVLAAIRESGFELEVGALERYNTRYVSGASLMFAMLQQKIVRRAPNAMELLRMASREPRAYTAEEAIELVHGAGGVASLAHPSKGRLKRPLLEAADLRPLTDAGLDALEVWHFLHDAERQAHYARVARELGLLATGGSDCHGPRKSGSRIGSVRLPYAVLEALRGRLAARR